MATIKLYTDISQSKILAEFLPIGTADMYYDRCGLPSLIDKYVTHESIKNDKYQHLFPCWSLAALLGVFLEYNFQKTDWGNKTEYKIVVTINEDSYASNNYSNEVDACVDIIVKLHELNLL